MRLCYTPQMSGAMALGAAAYGVLYVLAYTSDAFALMALFGLVEPRGNRPWTYEAGTERYFFKLGTGLGFVGKGWCAYSSCWGYTGESRQ